MQILGITFGDPNSIATYSGVPFHLFSELEQRGLLVGRIDADQKRYSDFIHGIIDWRRTIASRAMRRNAFWRYLPKNINRLTERMRAIEERAPVHDTVIQFGVAGLPIDAGVRVAHAEISIETAASSPLFSSTYGFAAGTKQYLTRAIAGECCFLNQFDIIWTNTSWTAEGFLREGVSPEKLWVHPPACNLADPGTISRTWTTPRILFVGRVWNDKGGPLVVEAFRILRDRVPDARLTIIGCHPALEEKGVEVLGLLNKSDPEQVRRLRRAYEEATIFCMPSHWESVGIVYMEAALFGLPVVMMKGQGREEVFPECMAIHLAEPDPVHLGNVLFQLSSNIEEMLRMGRSGREHMLQNYTWQVVVDRLIKRIEHVRNQ